jgi:hypothetical protein
MMLGWSRSLARRRSLLDNLPWLHSERKDQGRRFKKPRVPYLDRNQGETADAGQAYSPFTEAPKTKDASELP